VALGEFAQGLALSAQVAPDCVEISALRESELWPLLDALPNLPLSGFDYVAIHAPSAYGPSSERRIADALLKRTAAFSIVLHPDAIFDFACWRPFGERLCIENMDKRKPIGRNCRELDLLFEELPAASFCLDLGHARQIDPTMVEAIGMLRQFGSRLRQIHLSEVTTNCRHERLSWAAIQSFRRIAARVSEEVPVIIESVLSDRPTLEQMSAELVRAAKALPLRSESLASDPRNLRPSVGVSP
jgi:hypothetical protein